MESREKTVNLLESFLSTKEVDGICGYIVDPDGEGPIQVIVVIDIDYIQEANTKPGFIARMLRQGVKQEIKKWIGFDVYVGSTARKCDTNNPISESMSNHVKRRLSTDEVMNELTTMLDYEVNIDGYNNASDAVEELCNTLNERILDDIAEKTNRKVSLKEKDELYWYLFNKFNKYITNRYNESKEMNESVVYNYKKGRNTIPERLPFDVNKLIDAGAIFITPSIEGNPTSKNYKKFLKSQHTHLITLYNIKNSPEDSWIHTAITKSVPPTHWEGNNFSNNLYDGKYNQILWSLKKLGINNKTMLIDDVKESKKKYIVTEQQYNLMKEYFDPLYYLKKIMNNAPKYIRNPNTLKYDVAFQKVVDTIFKYTMKDAPVDNLKGLEVTKVTPQGWGSDMKDDSKGSHTEWIVLLIPILPKWFNPDDIDYRTQLEDFKREFASIANMMGLSSSSPMSQEGYPNDKVKFFINNN